MQNIREELDESLADKIEKVRIEFHNDHPFFQSLSHYVTFREDKSIATCAVDAKGNLFYNPDFFNKLKWQEMMGIVAHELMHIVSNTLNRMPKRADPKMWNIAADCAINYILFSPKTEGGAALQLPREEICKPVFSGICPELKKYDNWPHEAIYADMSKNAEEIFSALQCPQCGDGDGEDSDSQSGGGSPQNQTGEGDVPNDSNSSQGAGKDKYWWDSSAEQFKEGTPEDGGVSEEDAFNWQNKVFRAADIARRVGKLPGSLENFLDSLLRPKKNWRKELAIASEPHIKPEYTWRKIGRRTAALSPHIRTPGMKPELPLVVIAGDTSGSMTDDNVRRFLSESLAIIRLLGGKAYMILHDSYIYYTGDVDEKVIANIKVKRGGTDFRPTFEHVAKLKEKPNLLVYFSDMEGPMPEVAPPYPVIWCQPEGWSSTRYHRFGRIIKVED